MKIINSIKYILCNINEKDYEIFYNRISEKYRNNSNKIKLLKIQIRFAPYIYALIYLLSIVYLIHIKVDNKFLLKYTLIPAFSFLLVSALRKTSNYERPYEKYKINPLIENHKKGQTYPSRHVFSASIISMCLIKLNPILGIFLLVYSIKMAHDRVIAGIHFPSDVLFGLELGILSSVFIYIL